MEDLLTEGPGAVEVVHILEGDAAISRLAQSGPEGRPDLVPLDLDMPGMDGSRPWAGLRRTRRRRVFRWSSDHLQRRSRRGADG